LIDSAQQIARYYRKGICPVWAKHTLWARIDKNTVKITNFHVSTYFTFVHVLPPASNTSCYRCLQTTIEGNWRNFGCFREFFVPFGTVLLAFFWGDVCLVLK